MKYKYLDLKPLPQQPLREHVYQPTEEDEKLSAQMKEVSERIKKQLEGKWTPTVGDKVLYVDKSTLPLGYSDGDEGTVAYVGDGWFQVEWTSIGMRSYGLNCVVSEWIIKAP